MDFNLKEAVRVANQVLVDQAGRHLTDVEILILEGSWARLEYHQIAAKHQYTASYISQDAAPKLWRLLSSALGEKVKKSNFREALRRTWEEQLQAQVETETKALERAAEQAAIASSASPLNSTSEFDSASQLHPTPPPVIPADYDFYVERPPVESICEQTLQQPGALIRVKAPRLMGKTMLLQHILGRAQRQGFRTVSLSLEMADRRTHLTDLDRFLRWFCLNLTRELRLPNLLDEYWDEEGMGSKVSCSTYFEEYLLEQDERPLLLCLDDVDLLFPHPEVYEDFFGLLRSWYERARSRPPWPQLRLVISHATDVYIRLNINQSPFNVGVPIDLPEFDPEQALALAQHYGLSSPESPVASPAIAHPTLSAQSLNPLMKMVGGHPDLLAQSFAHLKDHPETSLETLLKEAPTDAGIYGNHLREHWLTLQQHPELSTQIRALAIAPTPLQFAPVLAHQLQSMGLVTASGKGVALRCELYRQYFKTRLEDPNQNPAHSPSASSMPRNTGQEAC